MTTKVTDVAYSQYGGRKRKSLKRKSLKRKSRRGGFSMETVESSPPPARWADFGRRVT